eukprot:99280_1
MRRVKRMLNHCSQDPSHTVYIDSCAGTTTTLNKEYMHFWKRPETNSNINNETQTQMQHHKQKDRNDILKCMEMYNDRDNDTTFDTHHIMDLFAKWIRTAFKYSPTFIKHANAICLSTIDNHGYPSSRYVLLKSIEKKNGEFIFFTNYNSNKAFQIENVSNHASMTLYW